MCSGVKVLSSVEATSKSVWKSLLFKLTKNLKKKRKTKRCHKELMISGGSRGAGGTAPPPPRYLRVCMTGPLPNLKDWIRNWMCTTSNKLSMSGYLLSFKNLKTVCVRINWIPKIMVQFCCLRLYLGTETISCRLFLRMARMDMDWKLKTLGQLFQVLMLWLQKSPQMLIWLVLLMDLVWYLLYNSTRAFCV